MHPTYSVCVQCIVHEVEKQGSKSFYYTKVENKRTFTLGWLEHLDETSEAKFFPLKLRRREDLPFNIYRFNCLLRVYNYRFLIKHNIMIIDSVQ